MDYRVDFSSIEDGERVSDYAHFSETGNNAPYTAQKAVDDARAAFGCLEGFRIECVYVPHGLGDYTETTEEWK